MIHANDIRLTINADERIAASTAVIVELHQSLRQYVPIPGTEEDDGWAHYQPAELSWSLSADALLTDDFTWIRELAITQSQSVNVRVGDDTHSISGTALLSEVTTQGEPRKLAKFTAKFSCNEFPRIL